MTYRTIGALLILAGCGSFGFSMAKDNRNQEQLLCALHRALKCMEWELQYRLTALPDLCIMAGKEAGGPVGNVFHQVSRMLSQQAYPDVSCCMQTVLAAGEDLPRPVRRLLRQIGTSLGRFDLTGQLDGLQSMDSACREQLAQLKAGQPQRLRSYRTLGLCAGAAIAILLV